MENDVIRICGQYPENFEKQEIASNPDFIFVNDQSYPQVKVFDVEENYVFVNSFTECEHYVTGGWNFDPIFNYEIMLQSRLTILISFFYFGYLLFKKMKKATY
ncbi:hypothetical protein CBD81_002265 [bacterium TMED221]|nr:MAG: hypothetical protein CBD81_002265 [bacterium TMED221]